MKVKEFKTKYSDAYILALSDFHIGDKGFNAASKKKLKDYIKWIRETPNAYVILNGDLLNVATRTSVSSPFDQNRTLGEQIDEVISLLRPIRSRILGAIDGNHEQRLSDFVGYSPTITICDRLGIDYMGSTAIYLIRLEARTYKNSTPVRGSFSIFAHHTTGGGRTDGSKINRVIMLKEIVPNCDIYVGSHSHSLVSDHREAIVLHQKTGKLDRIRQLFVISGGYLDWNNSYAEKKMLPPGRIGSARIHLFLKKTKDKNKKQIIKKDYHVSL